MHHSFYSIIITAIVIQTYGKVLDLSYYKVRVPATNNVSVSFLLWTSSPRFPSFI